MLNLIFAPSADILVPLAEERIRGAWGDPFDPPVIIVPNPAVGKWLSIRLTEQPSFGCLAAAKMLTLEKFLWNALGPGSNMEMLSAGHIAQVICALLDDILYDGIAGENGKDIYAPLRDYLRGGERQAAAPLKRVQLSERIARQFIEYEYNRPSVWDEEREAWRSRGIDAQWLLGKAYLDGRPREAWQMELYSKHEAWQKDLYCKVDKCFADADEAIHYITLPRLYRLRREERAKAGRGWCDAGSNPRIILFGVSKISHFHRNTLVEISQIDGVDMHVFLTNPCAEFWEDVDTSRRPRRVWRREWKNRKDAAPDENAGIKPVRPEDYKKEELAADLFPSERNDNALLKLWGRAGKENIYLWCPQADWNFEYHSMITDSGGTYISADDEAHLSIRPDTLLKSIQKSLLLRDKDLEPPLDGNIKNDRSLQILACPDMSREVEELREQILDIVHEGKIENFCGIAVYMPDTNKYLPHIRRVFGAKAQHDNEYIPFTVLGASGGASLTARGWVTLLDIIGGEFNRARIFELLRNPVVRESRKLSDKDVWTWEQWAEHYGMFRGFNAEQRKSAGDICGHIPESVADTFTAHTFEHGIERVLSKVAADENGTESDDSTVFAERKKSAECFLSLLSELNELSAKFTNGSPALDVCEAVDSFHSAIELWLGTPPKDNRAETLVKREALNGLERIKLRNTPAKQGGITRDEFIALARGCVPEELAAPSSAWTGITFAPLRSSMVLPHRVIFVLGLDATEFPGTNESGSWNLLARKRIIGDSDRVRDNRFAFLELMHAAKERLVLSFVARNMQKDEQLQPSSVIPELEEYLKNQFQEWARLGLVESDELCPIRRTIPWIVHESLQEAVSRGRGHGTWDKAQRGLAAASADVRVDHRHNLEAQVVREYSTGSAANFTDIKALKKFFRNPLEYHLAYTLKIGDDGDTGDMAAVDEPVESGNMLYRLRKHVWLAVLDLMFQDDTETENSNINLKQSIVDRANEIYAEHINSGNAPEGYICQMERNELSAWAEICADAAKTLLNDFPKEDYKLVKEKKIDLNCGQFNISGNIAVIIAPKDYNDTSLKIGVIALSKKADTGGNPDLWLDGLTQWIEEAESGAPHHVSLVALCYDKEKPSVKLSEMKPCHDKLPAVEEWLNGILSDMLLKHCCEHLPFSAISEIVKPDGKKGLNFENALQSLTAQELKNTLLGKKYNTFTPGFDLTDARPPELNDDELREIVKLRYAPMLERWIHD